MLDSKQYRDRDFSYAKRKIAEYELTEDSQRLREAIVWLIGLAGLALIIWCVWSESDEDRRRHDRGAAGYWPVDGGGSDHGGDCGGHGGDGGCH